MVGAHRPVTRVGTVPSEVCAVVSVRQAFRWGRRCCPLEVPSSFTGFVRSRYHDVTNACFDLDDCKRMCCRRDADDVVLIGNRSIER